MTDRIEINRARFIELLRQITIEGADIEGLINWLDNSDFFLAPASTQYHSNYEGGLCQHSLNVCDNLIRLADMYYPGRYEPSTLIIVALLHDLSKTNYYEKYTLNKKVYNEHGSKHDNMGNFDWVAEEAYKIKDATERFIGGEHGENSIYLAQQFVPFSFEECMSIRHHHGGLGETKQLPDLSPITNKYHLVALLHMADYISTFISETTNE